MKCTVRYNGSNSDFFNCKAGLFQGEVLSPLLFSLYVNDCEMQFISENCPSLEIQAIDIFLLMYADDMVLISESPEGLQQMIVSLKSYTDKLNF